MLYQWVIVPWQQTEQCQDAHQPLTRCDMSQWLSPQATWTRGQIIKDLLSDNHLL